MPSILRALSVLVWDSMKRSFERPHPSGRAAYPTPMRAQYLRARPSRALCGTTRLMENSSHAHQFTRCARPFPRSQHRRVRVERMTHAARVLRGMLLLRGRLTSPGARIATALHRHRRGVACRPIVRPVVGQRAARAARGDPRVYRFLCNHALLVGAALTRSLRHNEPHCRRGERSCAPRRHRS